MNGNGERRAGLRPDYYRIPTERTLDGELILGEPEPVFRRPQPGSESLAISRAEATHSGVGVGAGSPAIEPGTVPIGPQSFHENQERLVFDGFNPGVPGANGGIK